MKNPTAEQEKVINAAGDLLVSASAGSGKTTVMLARVMRLITGGTPLSRMLISTFTNSAATDMRGKLGKLLQAGYAAAGDGRLKAASTALPLADISTLHTWCHKIIRKYFFVTGDDPAFEIAGEAEAAVWKREAIVRAADEAAENPESAEILDAYMSRRKANKIYAIVSRLMDFASSADDGDGWLAGAASSYGSSGVNDFLNAHEVEMIKDLESRAAEFEQAARGEKLWEKARGYADALRAWADGAEKPTKAATGITVIKDIYDDLKKAVIALADFREERAAFRAGEARAAAELFVSLARAAGGYYAEKKDEKGRLDFNDLERRAKQILLSPYGDEIRSAYDYIFIDEYQDINPLQESIIKLLKGNNTMFFVGDIKQSIYSFRSCSPDAFAARADNMPKEQVLQLNRNFRCKSGILAFCNNVFARVMTKDFGRADYARDAMFETDGGADDGSVEIIGYAKAENAKRPEADFDEIYSVKNAAQAEDKEFGAEAVAAAARVVELLGGTVTENGVERRVTCDDIVIIVRSRGGCVSELERLLSSLRVPVTLGRGLGMADGIHNRNLLSYMRLLDNRRDDIALLGAMRSFFGKFTDGELLEIRADAPHGADFADGVAFAAQRKTPLGGKVKSFLTRADGFTKLSQVMTVGGLAGKITAEFDYFKYVLGEREGALHAEALSVLLSEMNGFGGDLPEWLEYIDEMNPSVQGIQPTGSVRIMTVHAAKGLEFPFVLLCNLDRKFNTADLADGMCDRRFGLALESRCKAERKKFGTDVLAAAKIRRKLANKEEELRILYVAMTRAKEKLVLFVPEEKDCSAEKRARDADRATDWLMPSAAAIGVKPAAAPAGIKAEKAAGKLNPQTLAYIERAAVMPDVPPAVRIKSSVTTLAGEEQPYTVLADDYDGGSGGDRETGNAYHKALELYDYSAGKEQLDGLCAQDGCTLADREMLSLAVDTLAPLIAGRKFYREQPFIYKPDGHGTVFVQGIADMLIFGSGGCDIVDYKTGRMTAENLAKYRTQLNIYADAAEKTLGVRVSRRIICHIDEAARKCGVIFV